VSAERVLVRVALLLWLGGGALALVLGVPAVWAVSAAGLLLFAAVVFDLY
jgi:hypothetical protein